MAKTRRTRKDTDFLREARDRFARADDADSKQALREREDLAFYAGEQWPADLLASRQGQQPSNGMPAVPARPTLVINKVREPVRQVQNQERQSDLGVTITPADDFGDLGILPDETEVEVREGLVRRIQRDSQAQDARTWAFARASIAGRGYYFVRTQYLPGPTWDQEVAIERIYNQDSVKMDPSSTDPTGADADWAFVGTWMSWQKYQAEFGDLADSEGDVISGYTESEFVSMSEQYPDWFRCTGTDGQQRDVRVVDYWYTETSHRELALLSTGQSAWTDDLSELPEGVAIVDTRSVPQPVMKWCKIGGGLQVLDKTDLPTPDMPVIRVVGEEMQPYDEQRRWEGMVRPARDANQGFNYMTSKMVELIGLTPLAPLHVDPIAIAGYEPWYQLANTRTLPYLPSRSYDDDGRQLKEPHRPSVDPNVFPIAQSIQMFDAAIKSTTAVPDPTLGNVDPSLKSGRAIREVVANAQQSTSNFLDNLARAVRREGEIINNLLYPVYGTRPGRLVRAMTGEGEQQRVQIGDPAQMQQTARAQKVAMLTKDAKFQVAVKVTKSFDTRREQLTTMLGQIIAADPNQMLVAGDILYKNMDIPEAKALSDRMQVMLAPPIQKMLAEKSEGEPVPPAAQAEIAQLQQRVQHAEQAMQELAQQADQVQSEQASKREIAQMTGERDLALAQLQAKTDLEKAKMDNATKMYVADLNAKVQGAKILHETEHEALALAHEQAQADLDREQAQQSEVSGMAHEAAIGAGDQAFQASESERNRLASAQSEAQV